MTISFTRGIRYMLYLFLLLNLGHALWITMRDTSHIEELSLSAYPVKSRDALEKEFEQIVLRFRTLGPPEEHAHTLIQSDLWEGSAKLYISQHHYDDPQGCVGLRARKDALMMMQGENFNMYRRKYDDITLRDATHSLFLEHRKWEQSIKEIHPTDPAVGKTWLKFLFSLAGCGICILFFNLLEQGVLWTVALRYTAYFAVTSLTVVGGGGMASSAMAQAPIAKVNKSQKSRSGQQKDALREDGKAVALKFDVTYAGLEILGSPQRGSGQLEVAGEMAEDFGKIGGMDLTGFTFYEFRENSDLNYLNHISTLSHSKWKGLRAVSSVGIFGKTPQASVGVGIALKKSPLGKFLPGMDYVNVDYLHGWGSAAKNELVIGYSSKPIALSEKTRLVLTGFYRPRDWNRIDNNYGQLQAQLMHPRFKKMAWTYEAEVAGKSVIHLFGIKLFLK